MILGRVVPLRRGTTDFFFKKRYERPLPDPWTPVQEMPAELEAGYGDWVIEVSHPEHAISLEGARVLFAFAQTLAGVKERGTILDLGSGFSSVIFRSVAAQHPGLSVVSVDDSAEWLAKTADYLDERQLSSDGLMVWPDLATPDSFAADLILYDYGSIDQRCSNLPHIMRFVHEGTVAIMDDIHKERLREALKLFIREEKLGYTDLSAETTDSYGRYAWAVHGF